MSPNINNTNHFKGSTSMRMSSQHRCVGKLRGTIPLLRITTPCHYIIIPLDYYTMPTHNNSEHFNAMPSLNDAPPDYALPSQYSRSLYAPVRCHYPILHNFPVRCRYDTEHYRTMLRQYVALMRLAIPVP